MTQHKHTANNGPRLRRHEIIGIILLSILAHLGMWWLYNHSSITNPTPLPSQSSQPAPVEVSLQQAEPEPQQKAPEIDPHAVKPPEKKPAPKPEPKPEPKPKPKPKPNPKPKPRPKPKPKPEPEKPQSKPSQDAQADKDSSARGQSSSESGDAQSSSSSGSSQGQGSGEGEVSPASSNVKGLNNPAPKYPPQAMRRRLEGTVQLKILVEPDGSAGQVTIMKSSGHDSLDKEAVRTVKKWRFQPAKKGDKPIRGYAIQPITFNLPK